MAEATLTPQIDAWIMAGAYVDTNYGNNEFVRSGEHSASLFKMGLIKFDFSDFIGVTLMSDPILRLYRLVNDATTTRNFSLYMLLRNWTEAGVTYNRYNGTNTWETAGARAATDIDLTIGAIATTSITGTGVNAWDEWTIDKTKVQVWFDGTKTNYGMLLDASTEAEEGRSWASKKNALGISYYPQLTIEYSRHSSGAQLIF